MLKKYFCGSPWIHMRIENNGDYAFCRWQRNNNYSAEKHNIKHTSPLEYFQKHMADIRSTMLAGNPVTACESCYIMEKNNKVSGRQKQLLKIGVLEGHFEKSLISSPLFQSIKYSDQNKGHTFLEPVDWQIDLGNFCNSACVMCSPKFSSKLANEWHHIGLIDQPYDNNNWAQNEHLLEKFITCLSGIKNLNYLHFLGGETLITPAFKKMLKALKNAGLNEKVVIGLTTNLTVWPEDVIDILRTFKNVHIGLSIESMNKLNDYIRWPSKISSIKENLKKFIDLTDEKKWFASLRITPNLFTVFYIDEVYRYALQNNIGVESCNFIYKPSFLKIDLMPDELKQITLKKLRGILNENHYTENKIPVVNVRRKEVVRQSLIEDVQSVIKYIENAETDTSQYQNLVSFIKTIEKNRGNSVIEYAPEYENFLRNIGY